MPPLAHTALAASIVLSALGAVIVCLLTALYGFTPERKERPAHAARRRLLTHVGHAVAAACFAGTAILLVVVLAQTARSSSTTSDARVPALDAKIDAHMERLQGVEQRMKDSEQTLERLETEVSEGAARSMGPEAAPAVTEVPRPEEQPRPVSAATPAPRPRAALVPVKPPAKATPPPPVTPTTERAVAPAPIDEPAASPAPPSVTTPPPTPSRPSSSVLPGAVTPATNAREQTPPPAPDFLSKLRDDWRAIQHGWDSAGEDVRRALAPLRGSN